MKPSILALDDRAGPAVSALLATVEEAHRHLDRCIGEADLVEGAFIGDRLVGFGARSGSWLHPTRDWLSIHVHHSYRRCGVGTALLRALRAQRPEQPMKVRIPSGESAGLRFAARHGFARLVSSIDVAIRELPVPTATSEIELVEVEPDDPTFLRALGELYVTSHRWDPCASFGEGDVRRLLVGEDALPGTPRLARRGRDVVGVGLAYSGASAGSVEMACVGALDPEAEDGVAVTAALLESIGRPFLDRGDTISVECDFGAGANAALCRLLDELVGRPSSSVEILAAPVG